jgi:DNA recombination protein RmuC
MDILLIVVLVVMLVGFAAVIWVLTQRIDSVKQNQTSDYLKQDMIELNRGVGELREGLQKTMTERLDRNQTEMRDTLTKQLTESARLVADVTHRLTKLDETNRQVKDVADDLRTLQNVLQNPKQRGVLGEYFLQTVLENVLPNDRFYLQHKFNDGEIVDAAIILDKGKLLPIDSKFSLENYNRLVEETDKARRDTLAKLVKSDLKNRIDETSKYIRPNEGTMDFAFMFIPSEAVYYDLLINKVGTAGVSARDLIEYAFREKRVIIVSPTSFMAYLQTVMQGLRSLQIEEQAKDIQIRVGQLGKHIAAYDAYMQKLGNSLSATVNHYNTAHKELKKIDKDVIKIADTTPSVEPLVVDRPRQDEE